MKTAISTAAKARPEDDQLGHAHQPVDQGVDRAARRDAAGVVHVQHAGRVDAGADRHEVDDEAEEAGQKAAAHRHQQPGDEHTEHGAADQRDQRAPVAQTVDGLEQARE